MLPAVAAPASHTMQDIAHHYLSRIAQYPGDFDTLARRMHDFWTRPLPIATACSGTDAVAKWMLRLDDVMREMLGPSGRHRSAQAPFFSQAFACESDVEKIRFHADQFGRAGVLFRDVRDLGSPVGAWDENSGMLTMVPWVCLLIVGFSCKDASLQNSRKRDYDDVIRTGGGTTGSTWHGVLGYLSSVRPWAVLAENVQGLLSQVPVMQEQVVALGYKFHVVRLNAQDYCLPQKRPRVFFLMVHDIGEPVPFEDIERIVHLLRTQPINIDDLLKKAGTREHGSAKGYRDSGVRVSRERVGAKDKWVDHHRQVFGSHDLPFVIPTDSELGSTAPASLLELPLRERSIVQFWTLRGCVSGFLDVSEALERLQPVHQHCISCITGSAAHFDFTAQKLVPLETTWDVQGLDWNAWADLARYPPRLLKDLAANAFSIPTIAAVLLAMFIALPWPSSADEHRLWMTRGASGPPPTSPGGRSESDCAGVREFGRSGSAGGSDDGCDDTTIGCGRDDARIRDSPEVRSPVGGSPADAGDEAFETDMRDLEMLASLG